jgi:MoaA/NifB/PqqE/SkfB family radical SAM enzyme
MEFYYFARIWHGGPAKNLLRFLHILFLEAKRILLNVKYVAEFDLTEKCNLSCKHCYLAKFTPNEYQSDMEINCWNDLFENLCAKGVRRVLLLGGEPALRMDVILLSKQIFPYVDIITNGTIYIPEEFNDRLYISIDGNEQTHDNLRGKGTFRQIINNYKYDKRVIIAMTLTKENYIEMEDMIKLAKEFKFRGVACDIYTPAPDTGNNDPMFIDEVTRKNIIEEMRRLKRKYKNSFLMSDTAIKWSENPDHRDSCYWRDKVLHFDSSLKEREACYFYDCRYCGHFAGANLGYLTNKLLKILK